MTRACRTVRPSRSTTGRPPEPGHYPLIMQVVVGADHAGYELKELIATELRDAGYEVVDVGTHSTDSVDYPESCSVLGDRVQIEICSGAEAD